MLYLHSVRVQQINQRIKKKFTLSEYLKDKSQKVVDEHGKEVTLVFCPMFMLPNGELAGIWRAMNKEGRHSVVCETPQGLFFAE